MGWVILQAHGTMLTWRARVPCKTARSTASPRAQNATRGADCRRRDAQTSCLVMICTDSARKALYSTCPSCLALLVHGISNFRLQSAKPVHQHIKPLSLDAQGSSLRRALTPQRGVSIFSSYQQGKESSNTSKLSMPYHAVVQAYSSQRQCTPQYTPYHKKS